MEERNPIGTETPILLELACRMIGISIPLDVADLIIAIVDLIEDKGGDVTMKDILSLKESFEGQQSKTKSNDKKRIY